MASACSMLILCFIKAQNYKKLFLYATIIGAVIVISLPFYYEKSGRMQAKIENGRGQKYGSRTMLFQSGLNHFKENIFLGSGFATAYYGNKKVVGRLESGSGWLSILFQTGFIGLFIVIKLLVRLRRSIPYIKRDYRLLLFFSCFIFLCLHSCFEGYILTSGYYLCILFWMLWGYIDVYPDYQNIKANQL